MCIMDVFTSLLLIFVSPNSFWNKPLPPRGSGLFRLEATMAIKSFKYYFEQLRKTEAHRSVTAEAELRRMYKRLLKETKQFLAEEYYELAKDGKLTYEILRAHSRDARLLAEVEQRLNGLSPAVTREIQQTVEGMYKVAYDGMVEAVQKSKDAKELKENLRGLRGVSPETIKAAVENPIAGLTLSDTLEKNRKNIIWNIKREIGVGLTLGDRYETMAKRIAKSLDGDYKKAIRIVRTETGRVREAGHLAAAKDINSALDNGSTDYRMVKTWKSMKDGKVRDTHSPMNGITVAMDEYFILPSGVKTLAPKQSGVASEDINCRCFVKYDLMNSEEFEKAAGKPRPASGKQKQVKNLEHQEEVLMDEKAGLIVHNADYKERMADLDSYQYHNIWKNPVSAKDYETLQGKVQAKRDYFNQKLAETGDAKWIQLNDRLDEFVANGEEYLKLKHKMEAATARMKIIDDDLKDVRLKLMKAKGIDPDKIKAEIEDLQIQISALKPKKALDNVSIDHFGDVTTGTKYLSDNNVKEFLDDEYAYYKEKAAKKLAADPDYNGVYVKNLQKFEDFFAELNAAQAKAQSPADQKKLAALEKLLQSKKDELDEVIKRYGLEDDKFSQARKNAAYWFTDKNGSTKGADGVLRKKAGEVWMGATEREKDYIYEYTRSYHKYNEPLRGIEYGTNKFLGVGNVDMDDIGVSTGYGFEKGQIKQEISDITSIIEKSSYDFDIWVQRGCRRSGMDKFFGIDMSDFDLPEDELAAKLIGTTPTEYAFMSTGVAKGKGLNTSGGILLNVYAPSGTKMMYIEPISHFGNGAGRSWDGIASQSSFGYEAEVLVQRGTTFRVIKVEKSGGTIFIDMEVISQEAV